MGFSASSLRDFFFFFFFFFLYFRAPRVAYGSSQASGPIGAAAAGHSNAGSELRLQPTPQLSAILKLPSKARNLTHILMGSGSLPLSHNGNLRYLNDSEMVVTGVDLVYTGLKKFRMLDLRFGLL